MRRILKFFESLFDFFASIQLAVVVILLLGVISAVGTIYESLYDRVYAQKLIYHSVWMWLIMALLAVNITAVLIDRWPWKKHQISFVLAHLGILVLLFGSVVTYVGGIDGSMIFEIGGSNRYVQLQNNELSIYSTFDGKNYRAIFQEPVDFFGKDLSKSPFRVNLGKEPLEIYNYTHFALPEQKIVESESALDTPAVQFLIEGSRAKQTSWLFKSSGKLFDNFQMGPASFTLASADYQRVDGNELVFRSQDGQLSYEIYKKGEEQPTKKGIWQTGQVIPTGWMDFNVRVLKYLPHANQEVTFKVLEKPSPMASPALKFRYKGKDYDLGHNRPLRLYEEDMVYVLSYGSIRYDIGFNITLDDFEVGRYQGTNRAMTYQSVVTVEGEKEPVVISMNEPMKRAGLTFYQSSFQQDEMGRPTHSVLSVNKDPGRWLKYFGSFLIFLGIFMLFYYKDIYKEKYKKRFGSHDKESA